ncbi:precorrin-3B C(17)-methyltransferase, partial [Prochlorococcus sp. AH-716-F13]|nr:precorrin-3B C(17)-methyltransferase [Prochlorococcus sp. AH-716-F13]
DKKVKDSVKFIKPRQILREKWEKLELIIFVGSVGASIRLINSLLSCKDKDPGVIVIDKKGSKIIPIIFGNENLKF